MPKLLPGNVRHLSLVSCCSVFSLLLELHLLMCMDTCGHTYSPVVFNVYLQHSEHLNYLPRTAGQLLLLPLTALDLSSSSFSRDWLCLRMPILCLLATQFSIMSKMFSGFQFISLCPGFASFHVVLGLPHHWVSALLPMSRLTPCHQHSFHRVRFPHALYLNLNWKAHGFLSFPNACGI